MESEINRLLSEGFELIHTEAKTGGQQKNLLSTPKSTNGVLIEICQEKTLKRLVCAPHVFEFPPC